MDSELPRYSRFSNGASQSTSNAGGTDYVVSLERGNGQRWLSLSVKSRAPDSSSLPSFYAGDSISGCANLDIAKSESIRAITVQVIAVVMLVGREEEIFLKIEQDLWNPSMNLPDGTNVSRLGSGRYSWPFSIRLPRETQVSGKGEKRMHPLPPTYTGRASPAYIDYRLVLTVKRGAMRPNETLHTAFAYMVVTQSGLPSPMLQKAYRDNLPIMGPERDPEGWNVLHAVRILGTLFGSKSVEVTCTLAIAKPLSYARGCPMPLMMSFVGRDEQALDLLSAPSSIRVFLVKSLITGSDSTRGDVERRDSDEQYQEVVARAVFWPTGNGASSSRGNTRVLQGEIDVKRSLVPSFSFPQLTVTYSLEFHPFNATGFVASLSTSGALASQRVAVTSLPARGISARSHAPPEYAQEQAGDYNTSIGLLEAGNQRFAQYGRTAMQHILPP
ncbi:hypothetical protein BV22DRAFT_1000220 [Leucogyrophana mollusca]|uniref:Uncharacterized protein n=1 Tax=Leucogyrophana mollusca TaxID=85980 RepID=A0ACB8BXM8_9AGAM|nr:hypothetical protein BV22DRAFT_1000220 [Leucogyrophana mollusca]